MLHNLLACLQEYDIDVDGLYFTIYHYDGGAKWPRQGRILGWGGDGAMANPL